MAPRLQERGDAVPKQGVVVGEEHPHQATTAGKPAPIGAVTRRRVPSPGRLDQSIVPAIAAARSRIAISP